MKPFVVAALAALSLSASNAFAQSLTDSTLDVSTVVSSGLSQPISIEFLAANDILVAEKASGQVKRVRNGVVDSTPVLDLTVSNNSERGLLCIVKHPLFAENNFIYTFHTSAASDGGTAVDNRVTRWTWNGTNLTNAQTIVTFPATPGPNHVGGIVRFGPTNLPPAEQKLFVVTGDLNRQNQTENFASGAAPDGSASVLRLNDDGTVPTDGPFFTPSGSNAYQQALWAYGVRNSFGLDFDPQTGNLWDTENGPTEYDEINMLPAGANSGWNRNMGPLVRQSFYNAPSFIQIGGIGQYVDPVFSWNNPVAPTAILFIPDNRLGTNNRGRALVTDNNSATLYGFTLDSTRSSFVLSGTLADTVIDATDDTTQVRFGSQFQVVTDLRNGPDQAVYGVSLTAGAIYRISRKALPDAEVNYDGTIIPDGDDSPSDTQGTDFGSVLLPDQTTVTRTFTLSNVGATTLTLGSTPVTLSGDENGVFSVLSQPAAELAPGGISSFSILFTPNTSASIYTASVSVAVDIPSGPVDFAVKATILPAVPTFPGIGLTGNSLPITSGDNTPELADGTDFGTTSIVTGSVRRVFTITNTGEAPLTLTGSPRVSIAASPSTLAAFSVTSQPAALVSPGQSTDFEVRYVPTNTALQNAVLSIANNTTDTNPFTFTVQGQGSLTCAERYTCFVERQYFDFLRRAPDPAGVSFYVDNLCSGTTNLDNTVAQFLFADEFAGTVGFVCRAYFGIFNNNAVTTSGSPLYRIPDYEGLRFWSGVMNDTLFAGGTPRDAQLAVVAGFAGSQEWLDRVGNRANPEFVDFLYENLLGRFADATGKAYWVQRLDEGLDRNGVIRDFLMSPEAIAIYAVRVNAGMAYFGLFDRSAEKGGFDFHVEVQTLYGTEAFLNTIIRSVEYKNRLVRLGCFFPEDLP